MAKNLSNREDRVVDTIQRTQTLDSIVRLSTGVELNVKRVPTAIFPDIMRNFPRPKPPRVMNEDMGRVEENPNDPDYIEDVTRWNNELSLSIMDAMIVMGTTLHSVPKGVQKPEDTDWVFDVEVSGLSVGNNPRKRYLMWVKFVAAPGDDDLQGIMEAVGRLSGVASGDVDDAVAQFRDNS
jgi:hypothetical protein